VVFEMLGCPSISVALDIHSPVIPGMQEAVASAMEDVLSDNPAR